MSKQFIVETSARHVHLTESDFKILFGNEATLTVKKNLSQPGQYLKRKFQVFLFLVLLEVHLK